MGLLSVCQIRLRKVPNQQSPTPPTGCHWSNDYPKCTNCSWIAAVVVQQQKSSSLYWDLFPQFVHFGTIHVWTKSSITDPKLLLTGFIQIPLYLCINKRLGCVLSVLMVLVLLSYLKRFPFFLTSEEEKLFIVRSMDYPVLPVHCYWKDMLLQVFSDSSTTN